MPPVPPPSPPQAAARVSVVTGANSGIGLEVAAGLRKAGHHVLLACRSMERCAAAKAALDARSLPGSCECRHLDLADYASIRRFAAELEQGLQHPLTALVNNAGVMGVPLRGVDASGRVLDDGHFLPNHLGPYLLTRLLLPLMAPRGRVVTVASEAHRRGRLQIASSSSGGQCSPGGGARSSSSSRDDSSGAAGGGAAGLGVQLEAPHWYAAYARSKLANVLMTAELSRRLAARRSSVTAYSVSPGRVNTAIFANVPGLLQAPLRWLAAAAFQTPEQGARTVLHAALAPELEGRHELYLHNSRPCAAAATARDPALAADLWRVSAAAVGLSGVDEAALWPPH